MQLLFLLSLTSRIQTTIPNCSRLGKSYLSLWFWGFFILSCKDLCLIYICREREGKSILFNFIYLFIFGCAGSSLLCGLSSSCSEWGCSLIAAYGLLIVVASLVVEHGLSARGLSSCSSQSTGSVLVAHKLSCSAACGIFLDQGSNLYLLYWQEDSLPELPGKPGSILY